MSRQSRRGEPVHGWLILDKPEGISSAKAVAAVKKLSNAAKAGHGGTLDPLATGILPIALGEATKTLPYIVNKAKEYEFTVEWGKASSTDDREGHIIARSDVRPDQEAIKNVIPKFTGLIKQVPPSFSAVKIDGKRAYDLARKGKSFSLPSREIRIDQLNLVDVVDNNHARFRVVSGSGAYMRALARDLAVALGTVGHLIELRRTRVGLFLLEDAISLDELEGFGHIAAVLKHLLPVETALDDIPALALTGTEATKLRHGQAVALLRKGDIERLTDLSDGSTVLATDQGKPLALAEYSAGKMRPFRVLKL